MPETVLTGESIAAMILVPIMFVALEGGGRTDGD